MPHDLLVYGTSAARSGLTNMNIAAGEVHFPTNGTNEVYIPTDGWLFRAGVSTAEADNILLGWRFHTQTDPDWNTLLRLGIVEQDDTGYVPVEARMLPVHYGLRKGETLLAQLDNNNNAQYDFIALCITKNGQRPPHYAATLPPGAPAGLLLVEATTAHTHTAGSWSRGQLTFVNYSIDRNKSYRIWGASAEGSTLCFGRLVSQRKEWADACPGIPAGDTGTGGANKAPIVFSDDFPVFDGLNGMFVENLSTGADTSSVWHLWIQEL